MGRKPHLPQMAFAHDFPRAPHQRHQEMAAEQIRRKAEPIGTPAGVLIEARSQDSPRARHDRRPTPCGLGCTSATCGLLQASASGRFLSFNDMAFIRPAKAWLCPVTRRVLDVTFKGVTPYLPEEPTRETAECQEIALPQFDLSGVDFDTDSDRIETTRQWLSDSDDITRLRDEGIWSDLSDRIVEGAAYFRAAEHSAQQPSDRLQLYEKRLQGWAAESVELFHHHGDGRRYWRHLRGRDEQRPTPPGKLFAACRSSRTPRRDPFRRADCLQEQSARPACLPEYALAIRHPATHAGHFALECSHRATACKFDAACPFPALHAGCPVNRPEQAGLRMVLPVRRNLSGRSIHRLVREFF